MCSRWKSGRDLPAIRAAGRKRVLQHGKSIQCEVQRVSKQSHFHAELHIALEGPAGTIATRSRNASIVLQPWVSVTPAHSMHTPQNNNYSLLVLHGVRADWFHSVRQTFIAGAGFVMPDRKCENMHQKSSTYRAWDNVVSHMFTPKEIGSSFKFEAIGERVFPSSDFFTPSLENKPS